MKWKWEQEQLESIAPDICPFCLLDDGEKVTEFVLVVEQSFLTEGRKVVHDRGVEARVECSHCGQDITVKRNERP